jgi:DNA-directed RNA polymerase sigma subunit (sigma70/sigma32)
MPTEYAKMITWSRRRKARIKRMRDDGKSFVQIGKVLGISPQRAQQIMAKARA